MTTPNFCYNPALTASENAFLDGYIAKVSRIWGEYQTHGNMGRRDRDLKKMRAELARIKAKETSEELRKLKYDTSKPNTADLLNAYADALARNAKVSRVRAHKAYGV